MLFPYNIKEFRDSPLFQSKITSRPKKKKKFYIVLSVQISLFLTSHYMVGKEDSVEARGETIITY